MKFFTYHMPPFLTMMGFFYILVAAPILINLLRNGYWSGVFSRLVSNCRKYLILIVITILMVLGCITWVDLPVTIALKELENYIYSYTFFDFINSCGEGGFVAGVIFTFMMITKYFNQGKLSEVSKISLMSSIYGGLANAVLKFIFNRQRPAIGLDQWHFFAFFRSNGGHASDLLYAYNSMPSGHTISVVAGIMPFLIVYWHNKYARFGLISYAVLVAFSRVYTINHWLSDVTIAALFGVLIGLSVYQNNSWRIKNV